VFGHTCTDRADKRRQQRSGSAVVNTMGVKRIISLELLNEPVRQGDWVLVHVGFAISKLDEEEALKSLELFEEILSMEEEFENL